MVVNVMADPPASFVSAGVAVSGKYVVQAPTPGTNVYSQGGFGLASNTLVMRGRSVRPTTTAPEPFSQNDSRAEQLGSRTIAGVSTVGTRTKTVIPAGTIGNNSDITIIHDTWFSPSLRMVMESTLTDPRFGETIYSISSLDRIDPDESLFQVPPGYTVQTEPVYTTSQ